MPNMLQGNAEQCVCHMVCKGMSVKEGNHSQRGQPPLPSPTQARAGAVDTKVGKGELWGGRDPEKADQKRGQLLYLESVAGKERSV